MNLLRIVLFVVILLLAINAFCDEPDVHMICEKNVSDIVVCHEITDYQALNADV